MQKSYKDLDKFKNLKKELEHLKEYQCGDHPTRILYISNVSSKNISFISELVKKAGDVKMLCLDYVNKYNFILVTFYDLRHSKNAYKLVKDHFTVSYALARDVLNDIEQNQGTLVVFNIEHSVTIEEIKNLFSKYGDIKEIRETPNKKHHKFVEYYDLRDAQKALSVLNTYELKGRKLKIEPSRPGGIRQRLLLTCAKELGLGEDLIGLPSPPEMIKLITKEMKDIENSFSKSSPLMNGNLHSMNHSYQQNPLYNQCYQE